MADDLFPLDMHNSPVCEEEEEEGIPCEDEQVRKAKKLKLLYVMHLSVYCPTYPPTGLAKGGDLMSFEQ